MKKGALFAGLAILAVVAVGLFAVTFLLNKKEPLAVGDCIAAFEESGESRNAGELIPDPLDCADPEAEYKVLSLRSEDPGIAPPVIMDAIPACRDLGFPEATYYYQWGVPDSYYSFGMDYQRALCLIEAN